MKAESIKGNKTSKVKCSCTSLFQDREYGTGIRVANRQQGKNEHLGSYRCTICLRLHKA